MPDPLIENINKMMRDGPRLRSDYNTWIEAKTDQGEVVVGGVGGQGMGAILVDDYFMAPGLTSASNDLGYREAPTIEAESAQEIGVARGAPRGATVDEEAARRHADWWLNGPTFVEGANHVREEMRKIETREHVGRMEFRNLESVEVPGWLWKAAQEFLGRLLQELESVPAEDRLAARKERERLEEIATQEAEGADEEADG